MNIYEEVEAERNRAKSSLPDGADFEDTQNDYICYALAYLGRAARGVYRNDREGQDFRSNMIKAAGLIVTAIEKRG